MDIEECIAMDELAMTDRMTTKAKRLVKTHRNLPAKMTPLYDMSDDTLTIAVNTLNCMSQQSNDVVFVPSKRFLDIVRLEARRNTQVIA